MLPRHVYVHVPFCARRCTYCDFAIAVRARVPAAEYVDAVARELALRFPGSDPWPVDTLYFGGGTPSKLGAEGVALLVETLRQRLSIAPGAELTLEANPEDVTVAGARAWRAAGINRLSIGSQSFDDRVLAWMHRTHDAAGIERAVGEARAAGITDLSLDLIFALPPEIPRDWERDVDAALRLAPTHLSLYGLTVEPAAPLGRWRARGIITEAPEERYEREFLHAHRALTAAGFEHYEVSNFARRGRRARHNSSYWTGEAYAGLGPAAHELMNGERRWNVAGYVAWRDRLASGADPIEGSERLTAENRAAEQVYLGLRTDAGLGVAGAELGHIRPWLEAGWGSLRQDGRLVLSPQGWLRLDSLAADLTLSRSR
ncbi:MAG TPA: radical SAM family heme chaperone HemW [Gemmatimonadaceae bacterium]|nr:radical SAM family heme chaperone HemW [Gemmatimonadaceae bacterium]